MTEKYKKRMIRKAVIPAAGFGTRLLPATKAQPKEMLPIVDRPAIQYVVEESLHAGLQDILIITGKGKHAIEDHFDRNFELEEELRKSGRHSALDEIRTLTTQARIHYVRQPVLLGLGDAVRYARDHVESESFAVLLGDTLLRPAGSCLKKLVEIHQRTGDAVLAVEEVPADKVERYGILEVDGGRDGEYVVKRIIEKPKREEAPSNLAAAGRYILLPEIFDILDALPPGKNNEVQLTDALQVLAQRGKLRAYRFQGKRYDVGNKMDYVLTIMEYALARPDLKGLHEALEAMLRNGVDVMDEDFPAQGES
ncbi:MAG: UTP--glucose-1-phosphate uridylyltransferase [Candidatus Hinthialibacteria bacterium OLB16]|nr:MAG: UTP--glucose-1-phosphate uridylyltransferase [Candidatus Hinthialibacteria bacterium OLB16]